MRTYKVNSKLIATREVYDEYIIEWDGEGSIENFITSEYCPSPINTRIREDSYFTVTNIEEITNGS